MGTNRTNKQIEKELINKLFAASGYFKEEFDDEDQVRMKYNIEHDLPIFLETRIGQLLTKMVKLDREQMKHEQQLTAKDSTIKSLARDLEEANQRIERLIEMHVTGDGPEGYITPEELIRAKLKHDKPLTAEEKKILLSRI